ncbi:MAG: DUF951 domain-containing protein [Phascolarctobacterium sp.]|nr:DUF951 domain-containing protein [Phascolarctobacterium sp.]
MLKGAVFHVGDIVTMKKNHPCGSNRWEILRTGMDFGIKCCGCGHFVMIPRPRFEKAVKTVENLPRATPENQ